MAKFRKDKALELLKRLVCWHDESRFTDSRKTYEIRNCVKCGRWKIKHGSRKTAKQ